MINLDKNVSSRRMDRFNQLFDFRSVFIGGDKQHFGAFFALLKNSGVFYGDIADATLCPFHVIGDLSIRHKTFRRSVIGRHGRHDDTVLSR
jgi:hypothetical protein